MVSTGRYQGQHVLRVLKITELEYQLRDSEAKLILVGPDQVSVALKAAFQAGLSQECIYLFCDPEETTRHQSQSLAPWTNIWQPVSDIQSWSWRRINNLEEAKETTAIINYSSGYVKKKNV